MASYDKNSISMYFNNISRECILNHHGVVVVTFVRDFQVNSALADVIIVEGLCGAYNDTKIVGNYAYLTTVNTELRSIYGQNSEQKWFDSLSYEKRIMILKQLKGADFSGANIDGVLLFDSDSETKYGSCGNISVSSGLAEIIICDEIILKNVKINDLPVGFIVNVINVKGYNLNFDFDVVYQFWRERNGWNYTIGRENVSSPNIIKWTERRKNGTVDTSSINVLKEQIFDPIYKGASVLLDSRKFFVTTILGKIFPQYQVNEMMKEYDSKVPHDNILHLYDDALFLDDDLIAFAYGHCDLTHVDKENGVGILTERRNLINNRRYFVYINDNEGNIKRISKPCVKLETALLSARELYKSFHEPYSKTDNKENTDGSEYVVVSSVRPDGMLPVRHIRGRRGK